MLRILRLALASITTAFFVSVPTLAGVASPFAVEVIDYVPGAAPLAYRTPSAALGKTHEFTPPDAAFNVPPYVVTPFNATYAPDDLVGIGDGGRLVLRLGRPAAVGAGLTLGVHAGVGLIDSDYPNGLIVGPATPYTAPRLADVRVSADGVTWVALGSDLLFDLPTNWYAQGVTVPGAQETPGTVQADFTQQFAGTLSDFDNGDWPATLAALAGSAGGTWLDLTNMPLPEVNFIEFSVSGAGEFMYVDAVVSIPEPAVGALLAIGALALRRRR